MICIVYDKTTKKTLSIASGGIAVPNATEGKIWSNGKAYDADNIRIWTLKNVPCDPKLFHQGHKYMFVVEEDGNPVGVRSADRDEAREIDRRIEIAKAKGEVAQLLRDKRDYEEQIEAGIKEAEESLYRVQARLRSLQQFLKRVE